MLHFLDASITPDDSECNLQIPQNMSIAEEKEQNIPKDDTLEQELGEVARASTIPKKKMKTNPVDLLLFEASSTMRDMSKLATTKLQTSGNDDEFDAFVKFMVSELRAIRKNSDEYTTRMVKRKIQNILLETWDTIDGILLPSVITVSNDSTDSNACQTSTWTETSGQDYHALLTSPVSVDINSTAMPSSHVPQGLKIQ